MAKVYITEYARQGRDAAGYLTPFPDEPALATQVLDIADASAQSAAVNASTTFVRIHTEAAVAIEIGTNPTASTSTRRLPPNSVEYFAVPKGGGYKVAVLSIPYLSTGWFGSPIDRTVFEDDGTMRMEGDATVWNDWNLSRDFTPTAGAGVPVRNVLVGNIVKDQFAVNDALQYQSAELLHDWKEGSDMQIHIHWDTGGLNDATVRGVKWEVEYSVCNPIESGVLPYTRTATVTQSAEFVIAANEADRTEHIGTIYTIPGSTLKIGAQLLMRLKRIASVTNTAPAANPFVISFGVHFEADTLGSRTVSGK